MWTQAGWFHLGNAKVDTVTNDKYSYEIGVEKYLAMEALFNPKYIGKRVF